MTNNQRMRDRATMMSSTTPSAKYSCSGSPLRLWNGKTVMEGLSGRTSTDGDSLDSLEVCSTTAEARGSRTSPISPTLPTKRKPLRATVRTRCCSSPVSPMALRTRSEEHTSELQSRPHLVCRLLLEKKKKKPITNLEAAAKKTHPTK